MKYPILKQLAVDILLTSESGLSKVRFAKILYFVFKYSVKNNNKSFSDLGFVRLPLGPVPVGFMELGQDLDFVIEEIPTGLMYNRQNYSLSDELEYKAGDYDFDFKELMVKIQLFPTSELVELTHKDSSWKSHNNGQEYFITSDDIRSLLPKRNRTHLEPDLDDQLIQASMIAGMEEDSVIDSTFLEYPNHSNVK